MHPLFGYVPDYSILYIDQLVKSFDVHFKVVSPRKTKLGDCRYPIGTKEKITITINKDLHPFQFLVTSLHELAHAKTFREFGMKASAHGKEWKNNFSKILLDASSLDNVNDEEISVLRSLSNNPKATSYGHDSLQMLVKKENDILLKDIPDDSLFYFNKSVFRKIKLLRTYVLCSNEQNNKRYKIHGAVHITRYRANN